LYEIKERVILNREGPYMKKNPGMERKPFVMGSEKDTQTTYFYLVLGIIAFLLNFMDPLKDIIGEQRE